MKRWRTGLHRAAHVAPRYWRKHRPPHRTVSRQLTELKEEGIIDTRGRSCIILHDLARLAEQAGNVEPRESPAASQMAEAALAQALTTSNQPLALINNSEPTRTY